MTAIVLDTETTGLSKDKDRVVEVAVIDWDTGEEMMLRRANPEMPIPPEVTAIHGISDEDVRDCPPFRELAKDLLTMIETAEAVIGYNPFYDQGMLDAEFARLGITVKWPILVCAKRVWDVHEPREQRHLQNAFKRFVDRRGFENAHSALADVNATRDVLRGQIEQFDLSDATWEEFDPERTLWWCKSPHILLKEGDLYVNFGKYAGKLVAEVDSGFWRWVSMRDFPRHVLLLSLEMICSDNLSPADKRAKIARWGMEQQQASAP